MSAACATVLVWVQPSRSSRPGEPRDHLEDIHDVATVMKAFWPMQQQQQFQAQQQRRSSHSWAVRSKPRSFWRHRLSVTLMSSQQQHRGHSLRQQMISFAMNSTVASLKTGSTSTGGTPIKPENWNSWKAKVAVAVTLDLPLLAWAQWVRCRCRHLHLHSERLHSAR